MGERLVDEVGHRLDEVAKIPSDPARVDKFSLEDLLPLKVKGETLAFFQGLSKPVVSGITGGINNP